MNIKTRQGPVDPTCTFWPKGQCDKPHESEDACWLCGREVVREYREKVAGVTAAKDRALELLKEAVHKVETRYGEASYNHLEDYWLREVKKLITELEEVE